MVFSSIAFLGLFLPLTCLAYFLTPRRWRNITLAAFSILFYAWGEPRFLILMLVSIGVNFRLAIAIDRAGRHRRLVAIGVTFNLFLLGVFKYTQFFTENLSALLAPLGIDPIVVRPLPLPIGISFYTFHAISYLIDIHRRNASPSRNLVDYTLYISLFPQLVAGPIVRYKDIAAQLTQRISTLDDVTAGALRFAMGLAKKVLIANQLAMVADSGFNVPPDQLAPSVAWLALLCYTLQIYFDFSGYSDMAIGLARMFGFRFPENFNYPYSARSMQDFWRRWHMSLSTWFRDYVYIPLGGNRCGAGRTLLNLWIVFLLTGFWHGATWNFVLWGAAHGALLTFERVCRIDDGAPRSWLTRAMLHGYVVLAVMLTWVLFRADTLGHAAQFYRALAGAVPSAGVSVTVASLVNTPSAILMVVAIALATGAGVPIGQRMQHRLRALGLDGVAAAVFIAPALTISAMSIALGQYNPFIYFRF